MAPQKLEWQQKLEADGFVVLPGIISKVECAAFREEALKWLQKFPHGFKLEDRSTWTLENLPYGITGGLYNRYSVNHEDFVWKIRANPAIVSTFQQIWGTDDLIASFDGMNVSLPINEKTGRTDIKPTGAWPHIDQSPESVGHFEMCQGIANLAPNGPDDGGLCVMKGSHLKHGEYFATHGGSNEDQTVPNGYNYKVEEMEWFKEQGCEPVKICAGEGDLILWDSRLMHWNASPVGEQTRFATYVCYSPRSTMTDDDLVRKLEIFKARKGTTHWPNHNNVPADRENYYNALPRRPDGTPDPANRTRPFTEPEETPAVLRLVGVRA